MYLYIYNRRNHQAPKYLFVHTRAPAKAHSESAYDFPGPTPVRALLSRPFLEACYHSALITSSASATAPVSAPVTGDCSPALFGLAARLVIKASRILHPGALQCGMARLAMGAPRMRCVVWCAGRRGWRHGATYGAATVAMVCAAVCAIACVMAYAV